MLEPPQPSTTALHEARACIYLDVALVALTSGWLRSAGTFLSLALADLQWTPAPTGPGGG